MTPGTTARAPRGVWTVMPNRNKNLIGDCANAARGRETRSRNMPCCMSRESNQSRDLGRRSLAVHPRLSTPDHKCSSNFRAEIRNTAQTAGTAAGQDGIGRRSRLDDGMADGLTGQTPRRNKRRFRLIMKKGCLCCQSLIIIRTEFWERHSHSDFLKAIIKIAGLHGGTRRGRRGRPQSPRPFRGDAQVDRR